jgi:hypothetical protein
VCFIVCKTTSKLEHAILTSLYLVGVKNTDIWHNRYGDLQRAFPLYVPMVPPSALDVAADGDHPMCSGFSLGETIHLGSFEFITDYIGGLSRSHRRGNSDPTFMGTTRSGTPSPRQTMIEDSAEEFLMVSSGEGGSALPSPRRRGTGALPAPITTTPWMENALATQPMTMVPPRSDTTPLRAMMRSLGGQ